MPSSPPTAADQVRSRLAHLLAAWLVGEVRKEAAGLIDQAHADATVMSPAGHDRSPGARPATRSRARQPRRTGGADAAGSRP